METNGEQIVKQIKNIPKWIIYGYVIGIIILILASFWIYNKEKNEVPEPVDFTTNGTIGMLTEQFAYLNVQGLSDEVAIYGDLEDEDSFLNDRYYIALNEGYMYIVDLNFETIELLKQWQDYTFSEDENAVEPEPVTIYGMTESIPEELKEYILDYYNEGLDKEYQISEKDFENYFGTVLLNVRESPVDTSLQFLIILFVGTGLLILFMINIILFTRKLKIKKYLKKNKEYEDEVVYQLDSFVEEKYDDVIFTKDFFIDLTNFGCTIFKYSDVKWVHSHNFQQYGTIISSSIKIYLRDGKTKIKCLEMNGMPTEVLDALKKIYEKVPSDCLKGYSKENKKAFKQYKKQLKDNRL